MTYFVHISRPSSAGRKKGKKKEEGEKRDEKRKERKKGVIRHPFRIPPISAAPCRRREKEKGREGEKEGGTGNKRERKPARASGTTSKGFNRIITDFKKKTEGEEKKKGPGGHQRRARITFSHSFLGGRAEGEGKERGRRKGVGRETGGKRFAIIVTFAIAIRSCPRLGEKGRQKRREKEALQPLIPVRRADGDVGKGGREGGKGGGKRERDRKR